MPEVQRRRGRPRKTWIEVILEGMTVKELEEGHSKDGDREFWELVYEHCS